MDFSLNLLLEILVKITHPSFTHAILASQDFCCVWKLFISFFFNAGWWIVVRSTRLSHRFESLVYIYSSTCTHTQAHVPSFSICQKLCETTCWEVQETNSCGKIIKWAFLNIFRKSELLNTSSFGMISDHKVGFYVAL